MILQVARPEADVEDAGRGRVKPVENGLDERHEIGRREKPFEGFFGREALVPVALFLEIGGHLEGQGAVCGLEDAWGDGYGWDLWCGCHGF